MGVVLWVWLFRSGSKVTGSNFYYLKGVAAALEMALCQYSMLKAISKVRQLIEMVRCGQ